MQLLKQTKFLNYTEIDNTGKTKIVGVGNNQGHKLGVIKWYASWRKYCFSPFPATTFDMTCLNDITLFIKELMDERKPVKSE